MLVAGCSMLDKKTFLIPSSIQCHVTTSWNHGALSKPWPRPGFARSDLKDSSSGILQRPQCVPEKSRQGGLDINFRILVYEDI